MENQEIIMSVAKRIAARFTFPNYDVEDITQEAYIMGMDAIQRWDGVRPLENFLSVHIRRRLMNLKRDKYFRPNSKVQEEKKRLMDASPVEDIKNLLRASAESENIEFRELLEYIDKHLPVGLRKDYIKLINDDLLTRQAKNNLCVVLKEILEEYYENGAA